AQKAEANRRAAQSADELAKNATERATRARKRIVATQKQLVGAQQQLTLAQSARSAAQWGEQNAKRGEQSARRLESAARAGESAAKSRANAVQARFVAAQARLANAQTILFRAQSGLTRVNQELRTRQAELTAIQSRLRQAQNVVRRTVRASATLSKQAAQLSVDLERKQDEVELLESRRKTLENQVRVATESFEELSRLTSNYRGIAAALGAGRIAVNMGQVFSEVRVPPFSDSRQIRTALRTLLEQGERVAQKFGQPPFVESASSVELNLVSPDETLEEEQILAHFANYLTTFTVPVSVRLVAARNYARGETQYATQLFPVPVKTAYVAGETLATASIDGNQTDAQIFNQLEALVNAGQEAAQDRGVVPLLDERNPYFYAAGTNERIFDALRTIQMRATTTRVRLVAADELTTVEPMRVRFEVEGS
ncbi:MAG TPA: hypothetical protein VF719_05675, partial [Abditibacteriaceae bacterium]